jgi:hypothetical protein
MKGFFIAVIFLFTLYDDGINNSPEMAGDIDGAWELLSTKGVPTKGNITFMAVDGYAFYSIYDLESKAFRGSMGGKMSKVASGYSFFMEYDSFDSKTVGSTTPLEITFKGDQMTIVSDGEGRMIFKRIDANKGEMVGAWRITDRMRNGEMSAMRQGSRKTIKMLSGTRFQWVAYDPEAKSFSGTGGGTYTFENGKYTETIEYHSKNSDRVGAVLPFDYEIKGKKWDHSGLSSTGSPIREIWTRQN